VALKGKIYLAKSDFRASNEGPEVEINKSSGARWWQSPSFNFAFYLLFVLVSFQLWGQFGQGRIEEIPYSAFLEHVDRKEVAEAVVTDERISGTLTLEGEKTSQPRRFVTIPLRNTELASELETQGVEYIVRHETHWLGRFFFDWILPFGLLFLLWGFMARCMGSTGKGAFSTLATRSTFTATPGPR